MQTISNTVSPTLAWALFMALLAACGADRQGADEPAAAAAGDNAAAIAADTAAPRDVAEVPAGPTTDLPPNELGEILVLEYHRIGENEGEWIRSAENFRNDLRTLYEEGYRPVTMRQVLDGDLDLPAGTTPVVFVFDDSSRGQFYYQEDGTIDPNTFMGMWSDFRDENPGWDSGAVWCILPGADHPSNFFGDRPSREVPRQEREEMIRRKMEYLVENDHEVCNHTMWHARLDRYDDAFVQDQIGAGEDSIRAYLPEDYEIRTFALPLGMWPKNRSLAWQGTYRDGKRYEYDAVLEVSGGPNPSPFDVRFDPRSINRFIVAPGHLERQLENYRANPSRRYVSDGDPTTVTVPPQLEDRVDPERVEGEVRIAG